MFPVKRTLQIWEIKNCVARLEANVELHLENWKRLSYVKENLDVEMMFGQLFGSLCFDFHRPGSATPLQYSYQRV